MNYHQYSTPELVTTQLAQFIAEAVEATEGDFHLALSLEEHAEILAKALTSEPWRSRIAWDRVHFHLLHEQLGGADLAHRTLLQRLLFDPLQIPAEHIHAVEEAAQEPAQAATALQQHVAERVSHLGGRPQFDLALLEMGVDGHLAGVYPDQVELYISDDVFAPNEMTSEQGEQRQLVTVTLEALEESKRLVFLALGQDVRHAVGHIINLLPEAKAYPANFLAAKIPWVHLFADDQAMREKSYAIY